MTWADIHYILVQTYIYILFIHIHIYSIHTLYSGSNKLKTARQGKKSNMKHFYSEWQGMRNTNIAAWKQFALTWYNVQWKWLTGASVSTCACNCGSIVWGSCMKAEGGNQATLVSVIAHNFCSEVSPGGGTCVVHGLLSKLFISPEKSSSLSCACEGDFLRETNISSRDTASQ